MHPRPSSASHVFPRARRLVLQRDAFASYRGLHAVYEPRARHGGAHPQPLLLGVLAADALRAHRAQARPERISGYYAAVFSTTLLKPVFGLLSDCFPLGIRRRAVMVPASALAAGSTLCLGTTVRSEGGLYAAGLAAAVGFCAAEAGADGALVERGKLSGDGVASLQVAAMGVRTTASAAASAVGALLLRSLSPRALISLSSVAGACAAAAALFLPEASSEGAGEDMGEDGARSSPLLAWTPQQAFAWLRACFQRPSSFSLGHIGAASALLFALGALPRSDDAYAAFVTAGLRPPLSDSAFGFAEGCAQAGALLGTYAYGVLCLRYSTRALLAAGTVAGACGSLLRAAVPLGCFGLPAPAFVSLAAVLVSVTDRVAFMPQLVLCAELAPQGSEAAGFASFVALSDAGSLAGAALTVSLTAALRVGAGAGRSWSKLPVLVVLCAASRLLPLALLLPMRPAGAANELPLVSVSDDAELTAPLLDGDGGEADVEDDDERSA